MAFSDPSYKNPTRMAIAPQKYLSNIVLLGSLQLGDSLVEQVRGVARVFFLHAHEREEREKREWMGC